MNKKYEAAVWEVLEAQELQNNGWLFAGESPSITVHVNGEKVDKVVRVNRSLGIAVVALHPIVVDLKGNVTTKELRGYVSLHPVMTGA